MARFEVAVILIVDAQSDAHAREGITARLFGRGKSQECGISTVEIVEAIWPVEAV